MNRSMISLVCNEDLTQNTKKKKNRSFVLDVVNSALTNAHARKDYTRMNHDLKKVNGMQVTLL